MEKFIDEVDVFEGDEIKLKKKLKKFKKSKLEDGLDEVILVEEIKVE